MNLRQALVWGTQFLEEKQIEDAKVDAWFLFSYVTGMDRTAYFLDSEKTFSEDLLEKYRHLIEQRSLHIPLQHLTNEQDFMGIPFFVNEHVLIPRQETELLVLEVEDAIKGNEAVLDMCTGSGCIIISLKKRNQNMVASAVDVSKDALTVAKKNAKTHQTEIEFIESNLFECVHDKKYDIIVSNPPYIESHEVDLLMDEVRLHEPRLALDGMEDGLFFYREIIGKSVQYLTPGGKLFFEIGHNQGEAVAGLMKQAGFQDIVVKKDMAGLDRIVYGGMKNV